MKYAIAHTGNIRRLAAAGDALRHRATGVPGMGVVFGETGFGKTTAAAWWANQVDAVFVRAMATWTPSSMLGALMRELDAEPRGSCAQMADYIVEQLSISGRPILIDEADYIVDQKRMIETLRDLHDMATVPVVLIGMDGLRRKLVHRRQLAGRISEVVEFLPADLDDAMLLRDELAEVEIDDELIVRLHASAEGSVRLIVVGLARLENRARLKGLRRIGPADWGDGPLFFGDRLAA